MRPKIDTERLIYIRILINVDMENPFENTTKKEKKHKQIVLPEELIDRLKRMNKGSMRQTVEYLMGNNADLGLRSKVKELADDVVKLQTTIERLVTYNRLRVA